MITAQIAKNHLRENRPDVLAWADSLIQDLNPLTDGKSNTFAEAAVWLDDVKETGTNFMNDWHYTDRPMNPDGLQIKIEDQARNINSIYAINSATSVLTSTKTAKYRHTVFKAEMIRVLLHVVGDLHQPLHDTTFWNTTYPNGDQGGNLMKIQIENGTFVNLHSFWDAGAFAFTSNSTFLSRPLSQKDQDYLDNWAKDLIQSHPYSNYKDYDMTYQAYLIYDLNNCLINLFKNSEKTFIHKNYNPTVWTYVGYRQAQQFVYPMIQSSNNFNKNYVEQAKQFCESNLVIGGYRLASKLIEIFDKILLNESKIKLDQ